MPNKLSPHDRYIRSMLSHPKVTREFFEANLPAKIKDAIDFQSIELQKESFIDDKLRLKITDLLYAVDFEGNPGYIYILLEHASKSDPLLPFRMLKYMVAIMDHHLTKTEAKELPVIYPLILYTGKRPYSHSMDLFDLFGAQKELVKDILKNPYHLIDLTQVSDEDLKKYLWFGTAALFAKHIYDKEIVAVLKDSLEMIRTLEKMGEFSYIYIIVSYIIEAGEASDKKEFIKVLTTGLESMSEEKIMTILEQFKPEIYERGIEKGIEKGKAETLQNVGVAFNLLIKLQKSVEEVSEATGLSIQEVEALQKQIH